MIEAVSARIEAHYGEQPARNVLVSIAGNVGATVDAEWIVKNDARRSAQT